MRYRILLLLAATQAATPAVAQTENAAAPVATTPAPGADPMMNAAEPALTTNGVVIDPAATMPPAPPVMEDPALTEPVVTSEVDEDGSFPWGLLGLLGLIGLVGRFRS